MGICWYCTWGWSQPVAEIYDRALAMAGEVALHYGAAHIVWDDENFARRHVEWCLEHFEQYKRDDCTDGENEAVRQSLHELLALPDHIREPKPDAYDDEHPDRFPPANNLVMVRR